MATPSFMPSQTESKESTSHHLSYSESNEKRTASGHAHFVAQLNNGCLLRKKRWYLALSVNGSSTAALGASGRGVVMPKSNFEDLFQ
jgi:hypothetical protein